MKSYSVRLLLVIVFIFLVGEARAKDQSTLIKHILHSIQQQYAPDRRTAVFDISYELTKSGIILRGEVDKRTARNAVINVVRKRTGTAVIDSIRVLPDSTVGTNKYGIVLAAVADIRREPRKESELLTQATTGMVIKLLKKSNNYFFIQMHDQYLGWIDTTSFYKTDQIGIEKWNTSTRVIITTLNGIVYKEPTFSSVPLYDVVAGCILKRGEKKNGWIGVEFADGQQGFVRDSLVQDLDTWNKSCRLTGESLEQTARSLLNIPYLWGGTSVKGLDCSGFIKIVYRFNGLELHRDANQQAKQGKHIDPGENFEKLQTGDLLFFCKEAMEKQPKRITHVGLSLGNRLFIHSSGSRCVRLGSFNPRSEYFEEMLLKRFVCARRIIKK